MNIKTKRKVIFYGMAIACAVLVLCCFFLGLKVHEYHQEILADADAGASADASTPTTFSEEELNEATDTAYALGRQDVLDQIEAGFTADNTTVLKVLKPLYPDKIVLASENKFWFVDIDESLPLHSYSEENLQIDEETGEYSYVVDGTVTSHKGIDVSAFQGDIDWNAVAASGVEYAYIRGLFRGYGTGALKEDDNFAANMSGAMNAGLNVGVYVFSQAITEEELLEEANTIIEMVKPYSSDCTIIYDVEKVTDARMNALTVEERTAFVKLFCDTVAAAGYHPMIYFNTEMSVLYLDLSQLTDYEKWFAGYSADFYYPYDYSVWQYSESGSVDGIDAEVDLDLILK